MENLKKVVLFLCFFLINIKPLYYQDCKCIIKIPYAKDEL